MKRGSAFRFKATGYMKSYLSKTVVIVKVKLVIIIKINGLVLKCSDLEGVRMKTGKLAESMLQEVEPEPDFLPVAQLYKNVMYIESTTG